eukprot:m.339271 g.339271  ORF g.339271 m.339271 type:complete len:486 (+) comp18731_c0_seq1:111-1568(+)
MSIGTIDCNLSDHESTAQRIKIEVGKHGCVILRHLVGHEMVKTICELLGDICPNSEGAAVSHIQALEMTKTKVGADAYNTDSLPLHTDRSTTEEPPELILTSVDSCPKKGGEVHLVDGQQVIAAMNPEDVDTLRQPLFKFGDLPPLPLLTHTKSENRQHFRLRQDCKLKIVGNEEQQAKAKKAFDAFVSTSNAMKTSIHLKRGEGYVLNNGWYLHGRGSFEGNRILHRVLIRSRLLKLGFVPVSPYAIILDLDNCLFNFKKHLEESEAVAVRQFLLHEEAGPKLKENVLEKVQAYVNEEHVPMWKALLAFPEIKISPSQFTAFKQFLLKNMAYGSIVRDDTLLAVLRASPGPRVVLTNNYHAHAETVLHNLGVRKEIAHVIAVDDLNTEHASSITTKPDKETLQMTLASLRAKQGVLVDDSQNAVKLAVEAGLDAVQMTKYILDKTESDSNHFSGVSVELGDEYHKVNEIEDLPDMLLKLSSQDY